MWLMKNHSWLNNHYSEWQNELWQHWIKHCSKRCAQHLTAPLCCTEEVFYIGNELWNRVSMLVPRSRHGNWSCLYAEEEQSSSSSYEIGIVVLHCKTGVLQSFLSHWHWPEKAWAMCLLWYVTQREQMPTKGPFFKTNNEKEQKLPQNSLSCVERAEVATAHIFSVWPMDKSFCSASICTGPLKNRFVFVSSGRSVTQISFCVTPSSFLDL